MATQSHRSTESETRAENESPETPTLISIPNELMDHISDNLSYPDLLALKHTCRKLNEVIDTGVGKKILWLIERRAAHLPVPMNRQCRFGTDAEFCFGNGGQVTRIMWRRRRHEECVARRGEEDSMSACGCKVFWLEDCVVARMSAARWSRRSRRWMRKNQFHILCVLVIIISTSILLARDMCLQSGLLKRDGMLRPELGRGGLGNNTSLSTFL